MSTSLNHRHPQPSVEGTMALLACLLLTAFVQVGETAAGLAQSYAWGVGGGLILSFLADARPRLSNLVRTDVMGLGSLYFLTLFEFFFPQPMFNTLVEVDELRPALQTCLVAFAALAVGRHFSPAPPSSLSALVRRHFRPQVLILLLGGCLGGGYAHMFMAVDYDFFAMIDYFMAPRFAQPWGRGKYGDIKALFYEIGMVLFLVPPLAGVILAQRRSYSLAQLMFAAAALGFTLFYGFTSGTRNVFATYLATFLVAYAFTAGLERKRELLLVAGSGAALLYAGSRMMLDFRNIGFTRYLQGERQTFTFEGQDMFFVDYNLYVITELVQRFPRDLPFLGWEIPYLALVRPIPRAFWPGKPEGMSIGIEEALGAEGLTLASTFIGEAYMSGGLFAVALTGVIFGVLMSWWNKLALPDCSPFGHLIFASGFFAAVISMRSMLVFTTAILPTIAALVVGHWLVSQGLAIRRQHRDHHTP